MSKPKSENTDLTYEQAFTELETIVETLENGQQPLEQALKMYERGQVLAQFCGKLLDDAELKIKQLNPSAKTAVEDTE